MLRYAILFFLIGSNSLAFDFQEPKLHLTPEELKTACLNSQKQLEDKIELLAQIPEKEISLQTFLVPLEQAIADHKTVTDVYRLFNYTKPTDMDLSATVKEFCSSELPWIFTRSDLARKLDLVKAPAASEESALKNYYFRQFEWSGAFLKDSQKQQLLDYKKEILDAKSLYYSRKSPNISFSKEELVGLSEAEIAAFPIDASGALLVPASWNLDYLSSLSIESSRKKYLENVLRQNKEITTQAMQKSAFAKLKASQLLGFPSWVDFKIRYMAFSDKEKTLNLVGNINENMVINTKKDLKILADLKKEMDPQAGPLQLWDIDFFNANWLIQNRNLDLKKVSEYFPAKGYSEKLFAFYGKLFALRFVEQASENVWHQSVKKIEVYDQKTGAPLGLIYFDIVSYPGKSAYSVSANSLARYGRDVNGVRQTGLCSLQAHFMKDDKSLITHGQAIQLAHELGHCIHSLTYTGKYSSLAFPTADFLELPSQMLELFLWTKEGLQALTGHFERPQETMPEEMMAQLIASTGDDRGFQKSLYALGNETDLAMHSITTDQYDPVHSQCELFQKEFGSTDNLICETNPAYGHFMHEAVTGYAGSYYSYDLDMALAKDIFSEIQKLGPLGENTLTVYRKKILAAGASKNPLDLIKDFLGREPHIH